MNLAHLHLLLNHVPTVGLAAVLALYVWALVKKSDDLKQTSFVAFFLLGLLAIPAYLTGNAAQFSIQERPEVSQPVIAAHQDAALTAFIVMEVMGFVAWLALWRFRRWHETGLLVLGFVTFALMARAASIGGYIRHPEILLTGTDAPTPGWPQMATAGAALVLDNPWVWPIAEVFHFVGLILLFGVILLVNLRLLGFVRGVALADVTALLPWAFVGLGLNIVTGWLFFLAAPAQYTQNRTFVWKIGVLLLAGVTVLYPTLAAHAPTSSSDARTPLPGRIIAAASIVLWLGVIFLGRFLPFLGSE